MEKITQLSRFKIRWLTNKTLILMLFGLILPMSQVQAQYCTPVTSSGCTSGDDLNSVVLTGHAGSVLSDLNTGCTTTPTNGYSDRTSLFTAVDLMPSQTYQVQLNTNYGSPTYEKASIWIDFNNDFTFSASEKLLVDLPLAQSPAFATASITIPFGATPGIKRMRVRVVYTSGTTTNDACTSVTWGDTHDYNVNILTLPACSGTVNAGTAVASETAACIGKPINLSLSGNTIASGITFQWQSSPAGANTFTDISGATGPMHTIASQTTATDYRCVVTCTSSNSTKMSTVVSVAQNPITNCYCIPTYTYACSGTGVNLNSVKIIGEGTSIISDLNTGCSAPNYQNRTSNFTPVNLLQDSKYEIQLNTNYTSASYVWASVWIDLNNDGVFDETSEKLLTDMQMATTPSFASGFISIPDNTSPGIHRLRIRTVYYSSTNACELRSEGETHDYNVNIVAVSCFRPVDIQISDVTKNSAVVTLTPNSKNTGAVTYQYEVRTSGAPGSGATGLAASGTATTNPFTVSGLPSLTAFQIYVKTVCSSTDSSGYTQGPEIKTMCDYPNLIAAPAVTVCGPQEVDLTAIYDAGIVTWFDAAEDGNVVHTGATFTTPYLTTGRSYWVMAGDAPVDVNAQVGNGTATNATTGTFLYHSWGGYKHQYIFTAAELTAAGLAVGEIKGLSFEVVIGGASRTNFSISIGATNITTASGLQINNNLLTPVYNNANETFTPGLKTFSFNTPFYWDGLSNIVVQTNWSNNGGGNFSSSGTLVYHNAPAKRTTYSYANNVTATQLLATISGSTGGSGGTTTTAVRPNTMFIATLGCKSVLTEVPVTITPKPDFQISKDKVTSCKGDPSEVVTITTNLGGYDTFVWTPSTGVIGNAATGWTFSTTTEQEYVLSASQSNGICEHLKTVLVSAGNKPQSLSTLASTYDICKNTVQELKALEPIQATASIGSKINTTSANSVVSAFVQSDVYSKQQYIFSAAELLAQGITTSGYISGLSFETINSGASFTNPKYTIKMKMVPSTTFGSNNFETTGLATVFSKSNYTHTFQGVQTMMFDSPFFWDGLSNVLVEISQEGMGGGNNAQTYFTAVAGSNVGIYGTSATSANITTGTRTTERLDVTFNFKQSMVTWSPTNNLYADAAATMPYVPGTDALKVYMTSGAGITQMYNATITAPSGCTTVKPVTVNVIDVAAPIVQGQTFCQPTPVTSVVVTSAPGSILTFYNSPTTAVATTTISQTGTYYVEARIGNCKSARIPFTATITTLAAPSAQLTQVVCGGGTVASLMATGMSNAQIRWYDSMAATVPLTSTHPLVDNTTYYASQAMGACESDRIAVLVDVNPTPAALTPQTISICGSINYAGVNLNQLPGSELVWYPSATSQTPIPGTNQVVTGTYYVSQRVNGCESLRVQITATSQGSVPAPTAGIQNICGAGTVAQLNAQILPNATAEWYSSSTAVVPLALTAPLVNGTYYVAQRIGNCVSAKIPVAVRVVSTSAPAINSMNLCEGATVADLVLPTPTGVSYRWYVNTTSNVALPSTDVLQTGYYFVARVENGCESSRTPVLVTINSRPNSPVGASPQTFTDYAEISNFVMTQPNVVWYATYEDAMKGINPLAQNMPLVDKTTYYAVIIGSNGCPSYPTPIEARIVLGVNNFDLSKLTYYPNPVNDQLTITYSDVITNVEVFDLNGRLVMKNNFDKETVQLDFSRLSAGTYMLNIKTKENSQFIKIVKK
ncbi:GEVED domain-containing protein [Myroides sp. JBRI-B21084]|uniref:Ig-like domain-containing protein n=1 Tax=Myroides sp. JBRI-B21084 TaxID=3119977 RepID=UPI0026E322CB|nr:GEVED domain-containing protein [Paenimyroides cloacae]WKW46340.1 GEVED domain-containing protein [Paenimyroides cloacae]